VAGRTDRHRFHDRHAGRRGARDNPERNEPKQAGLERVFTAAGRGIDTRLELVERESLTASHGEELQLNPDYPQELQPRARDRLASQSQIAAFAGGARRFRA